MTIINNRKLNLLRNAVDCPKKPRRDHETKLEICIIIAVAVAISVLLWWAGS